MSDLITNYSKEIVEFINKTNDQILKIFPHPFLLILAIISSTILVTTVAWLSKEQALLGRGERAFKYANWVTSVFVMFLALTVLSTMMGTISSVAICLGFSIYGTFYGETMIISDNSK